MLQSAIEAEVQDFMPSRRSPRRGGKSLVVRNGYQPSREMLTGAGPWK